MYSATEELITAIENEQPPIPLLWPRLSGASQLLKPGSLSVIGGRPGCGKSFLALSLGLSVRAGSPKTCWGYLPLESDRNFHLRRMAAILDESWDALLEPEDDSQARDKNKAALARVKARLDEVSPFLEDNPALPGENRPAKHITPSYILDWMRERIETYVRDVLIIDPLAMIDFAATPNQWQAENAFIQDTVTLAHETKTCIVLIVHCRKQIENRLLQVEDLQGGAAIGRLASSVILLQSHEPKESEIFRSGCLRDTVEHNRTITVAKTRNSAAVTPLAFTFGENGPTLQEHGFLVPKGKRQGAQAAHNQF